RETTLQNNIVYTTSYMDNGNLGNDHRFSWNVEYKPTAQDFIKISPNFSYRNSRATGWSASQNLENDLLINDLENVERNKSHAPNYGISGLYNRRLSEKGRNIFLNFSLNTASTVQDQERILETVVFETAVEDLDSVYQQHLVDLDNKNLNGGATLSYTEPLGQHGSME